jgi:hypothetical protein
MAAERKAERAGFGELSRGESALPKISLSPSGFPNLFELRPAGRIPLKIMPVVGVPGSRCVAWR